MISVKKFLSAMWRSSSRPKPPGTTHDSIPIIIHHFFALLQGGNANRGKNGVFYRIFFAGKKAFW